MAAPAAGAAINNLWARPHNTLYRFSLYSSRFNNKRGADYYRLKK